MSRPSPVKPPASVVPDAPLAGLGAFAARVGGGIGDRADELAMRSAEALPGLAAELRRVMTAPALEWKPGWLQAVGPLEAVSLVEGAPFATRREALSAISARRAEREDATFLVTRTTQGFVAFEYREARLGRVDLSELEVSGLPLGGDPKAPQTWVIDARGRVGELSPSDAGYGLRDLGLELGGALALPEPPSMAEVLPYAVPTRQLNHGKNVSWSPRVVFRPGTDIDELARILRHVDRTMPPGTKVKAGGSRHSFSPVSASDDVFLLPDGMKFVERVDGGALRPGVAGSELVRVGAGTTVKELNRALWALGKALPVLGGYDGQTIAGVLPTGTHGSVLSRGPLSSMVRSMDLVTADGRKLRVEPRDGVSDPAKVPAGMELVQDDDTFRAALTHLGCVGVVHSYTLEAVDRFYMKEVRTETSYDEAKRVLAGGNIYNLFEHERPAAPNAPRFPGQAGRAYHLELLFNPHGERVSVTTRRPTELGVDEPDRFGDRPDRDLFRALALGDELTRPALPNWLVSRFAPAIGWTIEKATRLFPGLTPALVDQGIAALKDAEYTQRSYNVFHVGDGANALPAVSGTLFVPLRGDLYLRAMDVLRATARRFAEAHDAYQTGPISMRFVKGSEALLGCPEDVCSFEIIFAGGTPHAEAMMKAYAEAMHEAFGPELRWHWGQLWSGLTPERVAESYPASKTWRRIRDTLDPKHRFTNEAQERLLPRAEG